ncbi:class I SAM-dependent methyltransferase [Mannheimia massilioguelmaensis]|uniref:class I SAM-dependent methyltransferase n=1 Tax=Mannheimia massilioguelmaensis TaxID=1604354 RepID=UPI0005CA5B7D|nr:class I SAM-dependent methyltransferase [Mannheimia massilioguelmaensis]
MKLTLNSVGETALITLYAKAMDYKSKNSVLKDQISWELYCKIDYDFSKLKNKWLSYYGILGRAKTFDQEIRKFIEASPNCIIVSLGAGLDTEFYRVDNGQIDWYNIDFPETIIARESLFDEHPRVHNISKSILDPSWVNDIKTEGRDVLFISEGVLMYLTEQEVKFLLTTLTDSFDYFTAYFDLLYKGMVKKGKHHDVVKKMNVDFLWGSTDGSEVVKLNPKIKQIGFINFTHNMMSLVSGWKKLFYPFIYIFNNRMGLYEYKNSSK